MEGVEDAMITKEALDTNDVITRSFLVHLWINSVSISTLLYTSSPDLIPPWVKEDYVAPHNPYFEFNHLVETN